LDIGEGVQPDRDAVLYVAEQAIRDGRAGGEEGLSPYRSNDRERQSTTDSDD
jgi:hypothetical protein